MAQLVEHIVHIDGVTGSSPVATTITEAPIRRIGVFIYISVRVPGNRKDWSLLLFEYASNSFGGY